jgi:hypothetical protein
MKKELRERIFAYNKEKATNKEAAEDLKKLLELVPPGIMKQMLRDAERAAILKKYGYE